MALVPPIVVVLHQFGKLFCLAQQRPQIVDALAQLCCLMGIGCLPAL
ncbi:MAG: hypothetical protein J6J83_06875 [Oscillospiraceae bacterium]|nr:hypothetical protein [Oscillospiraceae bacterium]